MRHMHRNIIIFSLLVFLADTVHAQNPYAALGIETKVLTLTEGKYPEFIPNDTFMVIGSVMLNTITGEVVKFLDPDTTTYSFDPTISTRFLSVDPIAREFPELTPYQFASNRPIDGIDLDGLEYDDAKLKILVNSGETKIKVSGVLTVHVKVLNLTETSINKKALEFHRQKSSKVFDNSNQLTFSTPIPLNPITGGQLGENIRVEGKVDINFTFEEIKSKNEINTGDVVLGLVNEVDHPEADHEIGGLTSLSGNAYLIEIAEFNKTGSHIDTHEKGHLVGALNDMKGKDAPEGYLMSYNKPGFKLKLSERREIIENLIYQAGLSARKVGHDQNDTRSEFENLVEKHSN